MALTKWRRPDCSVLALITCVSVAVRSTACASREARMKALQWHGECTTPPSMAAKRKRSPKFRAGWRGNLSFGLVSFPVEAVNALNRQESDIHFHQLHAKCHRRIHYQKVCPVHGEVS